MNLNHEKTVRKILDASNGRLEGTNLTSGKTSRHLNPLLYSANNNNNDEVQPVILSQTSVAESIFNRSRASNNQSSLNISQTIHREMNPQQSLSWTNFASPTDTTEPVFTPSAHNDESGWSSPPRTIVSHCPPIDRSISNPSTTTTDLNLDSNCRLTTTDMDIKSIRQSSSNSILCFVEQFQNDLDQIKDDYMLKYAKDRTCIEQDINSLINEERQTFNSLNRYLNDHRIRVEKHRRKKRKNSSSSSSD